VARRIITAPGHDRNRSLGWLAVWWIETFVVHGRGDVVGEPIRYGDEYTGFIVDCYAHDPDGRRYYDSAFFSRPKGTDKSGLAAALSLFEAFGPARFAGIAKGGEKYTFLGREYEYLPGDVMGKPVRNPLILIMATEEGQTGNVYDSIYHNLNDPDAPLHALQAYGVDVGKTRVLISSNMGGGEIRPTTAGASSKDGGLETFAVFDESHLYVTNQLREMFRTVNRNLRKRRKAGAWYIETTTMYAPGEESIAEETYHLADAIDEGKARRPRLLFDHRWADVVSLDKIKVEDADTGKERTETEDEYLERLRDAFRESYGDAIAWHDPDDLLDGLFDTHQSESETRRYFFNALVAATNAWVQVHEWANIGLAERRKRAKAAGEQFRFVPPKKGDVITLGFDGGRSSDATVLIAVRVSDGYIFPIGIWEQPDGPEGKGWQIDRDEVDAKVAETFEKFTVVAFFGDPPLWQDYVDKWDREYGDQLVVKAGARHSIEWWTKRDAPMSEALERLHTAIKTGGVTHGNHHVLTRHVINARRWPRRGGVVIGKDKKGSPHKMDAAIGATLAYEGCAIYRKNHKPKTETSVPRRAR
jgi:hypothetical protein